MKGINEGREESFGARSPCNHLFSIFFEEKLSDDRSDYLGNNEQKASNMCLYCRISKHYPLDLQPEDNSRI
jgi:hypothetical protein